MLFISDAKIYFYGNLQNISFVFLILEMIKVKVC